MLNIFRITFAVLLVAKAADIATRGPESIGLTASLIIAAVWIIAAISLGIGHKVRIASTVIIVLTALITVISKLAMYNQHLYLIASICLILVVQQAVPTLLRMQLSIAYGFAVFTKVNEAFLSGTVVYLSAIQRPFWETFVKVEPPAIFLIGLSLGALCIEGFLAIGFWFKRVRWVALVIGVCFHIGMLVTMSEDWSSMLRLAVFGFLMIALYIPFFEQELNRRFSSSTKTASDWELAPILR